MALIGLASSSVYLGPKRMELLLQTYAYAFACGGFGNVGKHPSWRLSNGAAGFEVYLDRRKAWLIRKEGEIS